MAQETTGGPVAHGARPSGSSHGAGYGTRPEGGEEIPATLVPETGWHFLHLYYRVDREKLAALPAEARSRGREELVKILGSKSPDGPDQIQCFAVPGHKADFGVVMAGSDLKALHRVQLGIQSSAVGAAFVPSYSFYSISEVSEYVPDAEEYARILKEREGCLLYTSDAADEL